MRDVAREDGKDEVPEILLQWVWHAQRLNRKGLRTLEGHRVKVVSPGWWNRHAGPDFKGAQLTFNGTLHTGDVEVHVVASGWRNHGHHLDAGYNDVVLHVILDAPAKPPEALTADGRQLATLALRPYLDAPLEALADCLPEETRPAEMVRKTGACSALIPEQGVEPLKNFLELAGDWRMLRKANDYGARMARTTPDQALYEELMAACGFSRFKEAFRTLAQSLPYDRAMQLAQQDPLLLEAALLHLAGLLPKRDDFEDPPPHLLRLQKLRVDHVPGLRRLPIPWVRRGIRPVNYPERRIAGMARLVVRTAQRGLVESLNDVWREGLGNVETRRRFEALFPRAMGFWASHCTWTGKRLRDPIAPIGSGRVRSIVGNVFVPVALSLARGRRDRAWEEQVYAFYAALPKEADNHVVKTMLPRVLAEEKGFRLNFRLQQGLLQMHQDWCEPNPSCRNCSLLKRLDMRRFG
jgi:hypothetical protein